MPKTQNLLLIQQLQKVLLFLRESIPFWLNLQKKQSRFRMYNREKVEAQSSTRPSSFEL